MNQEFYSQVQLSKETGISRSTIRDYIRDYADFIELQTGLKNGFVAYNETAREILLYIREMHRRGLTISVIKELLAEKYPMQINDTVSTEPNTSKVALRDKVPPGLVSKQDYDALSARVVALVDKLENLEKDNVELRSALSAMSATLSELNEGAAVITNTVGQVQEITERQQKELKELNKTHEKTKEKLEWATVAIGELQQKKPWWKFWG